MLVFAIETSCDETSVCIMDNNKTIFSHIVFSQKEHAKIIGRTPFFQKQPILKAV